MSIEAQRWWQRTPSWRTVRYTYLFLLVIGVVNITMSSNWWLQIVNAGFVGFSICGMLNATMMIETNKNFARLKKAYDELHDLNRALIENRVRVHIEGLGDEPPPTQPSLH